MKKIALLICMISCFSLLMAVSPIDHNTILKENEPEPRPEIENFDANPYFILSGEADKAIKEKDYPTAILRIRDALKVDPTNPSNPLLESNLALLYSYLDQDSLSLVTYDRVLESSPAMVTVRVNRALQKLKMGQDASAYQDFADVIVRDSLNATARYYHGMMSLYGGDLNAAETDFLILEKAAPKDYNTFAAMSLLYSMTNRERQAIPYYKELIIMDPAPEYYSALAGCYLALGDLTEAAAIITEGLEKAGEDPELYYYRAWLNRDRYLLDDAKADAKKAVVLGANPTKVAQLFTKDN